MTLYAALFYILAAIILLSTILAITRRNLVHAVVYLVISFFGSAMLFYLFGAPLLAALEVIIYAGAIMVLFLFIIMMLQEGHPSERLFPAGQLVPAALFAIVYLAAGAAMLAADKNSRIELKAAMVSPGRFGQYLFEQHWLAVEIVSLLLLIALVGALYLGKTSRGEPSGSIEENP
jgi:NADH-quinone oxidoreductase subunit J